MLLFCNCTFGFSQSKDSLENKLEQVSDTLKVNLLNQLSKSYQWKAPEKSKAYARQAYQLASRLNDKKGASYSLWKLGTIHELQGNYTKALDYFLESLHIQPPQDNTLAKAHAYGSVGNLYVNLGQYKQAQQYLTQSFSIFKQTDHALGIAITYRRLGFLQLKQNNNWQAIQYFYRSLTLMEALQDTVGIGYVRSYLGQVYFKQGKYEQALQQYTQAIKLQDKIGNYAEQAYLLLYIGEIYTQTGHFAKAVKSYQQALTLAEKLDFKPAVQESYQNLAAIHKAEGKFEDAFSYYEKFMAIRDDIFSDEQMENLADSQIRFEMYEKEQEIKLLKKEGEIQKLRLNENTYLFYFFLVFLILLLVVCGLIYNSYLLKKKANLTLQRQHKAIVIQNNKIEEQNKQMSEARIIIETQNQLLQSDKAELEGKVKERTAALMDTYTNLIQVNEELDTLVYKSSHDLRGPLATFMGVCNIAFIDIKEALALQYFGMLLKNAIRMDKLLHRLLKVNHVKHAEVNCLLLQPEYIINEILATLESVEGYGEMSFDIHIEKDIYVHSDTDLVRTILENLLENSIHYRASQPGVNPCVWIKLENHTDAIKIYIQDNGIGIPEAYIPKIFSMFSKGTRSSQGSGLGLHIARAAVHKLQGNIRYCDEITDATTFEVIIPDLIRKPATEALQLINRDEPRT